MILIVLRYLGSAELFDCFVVLNFAEHGVKLVNL